jgi:peptidoglycan/LPS O-acetylase OafA/YrhL
MDTVPRKNNITLVRFILAYVVLARHCMDSSAQPAFLGVRDFFASQDAVCLFFFLSGLLVTASYGRSPSLKDYAVKRAVRIFPLYLAAVLGAALVLCAASSLPAGAYFADPGFWRYLFWNCLTLNFMQRTLPGVFEGNPFNSSVNDPLWTIKNELFFYACLPLLMLAVGKAGKRKGILLLVLYLLSFAYRWLCHRLAAALGQPFLAHLAMEAPGYMGPFILGIFCHVYFASVQRFLSSRAALPCFVLCLALVVLSNVWDGLYIVDSVKYPLLAFVCLYASFSFSFLHGCFQGTDCSYAVYLCHYPLLQWMVSRGLFGASPWLSLYLCAASTFALALAATRAEKALLRK